MVLIAVLALGLIAGPDSRLGTDLAPYRGHVVVLNYWASWCEPCRRELPALERLHRRHAPRGVVTLGVSIDEPAERQAAQRLVKDLGLSFPIRMDGTTDEMFALGLATAVPATAIFDREGRRTFRIIGEAREADLVARVEWLLGDGTGTPPAELLLPAGITPEHFAEHEKGKDDDHEHEDEHAAEGGSAVPT